MIFWFKESVIFYKDLNDEEKAIYLPMLLPYLVFLIWDILWHHFPSIIFEKNLKSFNKLKDIIFLIV